MTRTVSLPLLALLLALPAAAQEAAKQAPRGFPLDQDYAAISISGFDVQKAGITLKVSRAPTGSGLRAVGHAGCNSYNATATIREDQVDFTEIATTKKFCGKPRMKTEEAFLTSLKSARRWRTDGARLIIEGEAARLLMTVATAGRRPKSGR
jgi:heat shock protein HslJ